MFIPVYLLHHRLPDGAVQGVPSPLRTLSHFFSALQGFKSLKNALVF